MRALLIDIDGVLKLGGKPASGLNEFLQFLTCNKIPFCAISNSTLSNAATLKEFFRKNKVDTDFPLMTAADATLSYVKERFEHAAVFAEENIKNMFGNLLNFENPDCVVVGDLGNKWNFETMNEIFNFVINGAEFIAMQKNRFWKTPEKGLLLDAGAFIKAIEFASQKEAVLIGKPSPVYFRSALKLTHSNENSFFMLGDDLLSDIKGAQKIGGEGILIYTGKTKFPLKADGNIIPDYETTDLFEAIKLLERLYDL